MEAILFIILQIFFPIMTHSFENWERSLGYSPAGEYWSHDAFRTIARERKYLMDYK